MSAGHGRYTVIALLFLTGWCFGEEPSATAQRSAKLDFLTEKWKGVQVHPTGRPEAAYRFQEAPLFRWQNPISGADGAVFAWTSGGRPVLLCKTHVNDKTRGYIASTVSIAREPIVAARDGTPFWKPAEAGIVPKTVEDAAPPAGTENVRLVQMRAIARRYLLESNWGEKDPTEWQLRLLPSPLMRYTSPDHGVIDGAIFGYAQGTNPEAIVIIEAIGGDNEPEWQSAPARLSGYAIRGEFDSRKVLDVPQILVTRDNETYRHQYQRLTPYPFEP
jgi:hypothetical protein